MIDIRDLLSKIQTIDASLKEDGSICQEVKTLYLALKKRWFQVLDQTTYEYPEISDFYQNTRELISSCDKMISKTSLSTILTPQYNAKTSYPYQDMRSVADALKNALSDCINSLRNIKVLEIMKQLYEQAFKEHVEHQNKPSSSPKDFWASFSEYLQGLCALAFTQVRNMGNLSFQKDHFLLFTNALIHQMQLLCSFCDMAEKSQTVFLRHLNQLGEHLFTHLAGAQCTGFVIDWGQRLKGTTAKSSNAFFDTLLALRSKQFPKQWPIIEIISGQSITSLKTMKYQRIYLKLYGCVKLAEEQIQIVCAKKIMEKAKNLFSCSENNSFSVLAIKLEIPAGAKYYPHSLGLARIYSQKTTDHPERVIYRFCDADYAEFEAYSEKTMEALLDNYLTAVGYTKRYRCAIIRNIDPVLDKLEKGLEKHLEKLNMLEIAELAIAEEEEPWLTKKPELEKSVSLEKARAV